MLILINLKRGSELINTAEKALEAYIEATNSHDFNNVNKILSKKAVYYFSDAICSTVDEIREYFESAWELIQDEVYSISNINWLYCSDDSVVCLYTYHYEGYLNGIFTSGKGKATNIFVKENQNWVLIHEHLSS